MNLLVCIVSDSKTIFVCRHNSCSNHSFVLTNYYLMLFRMTSPSSDLTFHNHVLVCGGSAGAVQRSIIDLSGVCSLHRLKTAPQVHNFIPLKTFSYKIQKHWKCNVVGIWANLQKCRTMWSKCYRPRPGRVPLDKCPNHCLATNIISMLDTIDMAIYVIYLQIFLY